jgi:putative tryptophan/tyrosine transport system substrate-binding protein
MRSRRRRFVGLDSWLIQVRPTTRRFTNVCGNWAIEGQNLVVETRYAEGKQERLLGLAKELVGLGVEIIVAGGPAISAAAQATKTIPIVAGSGVDLIASGLVAGLAQPGGNVTGTTNLDMDMTAKRLELLKESFPGFHE